MKNRIHKIVSVTMLIVYGVLTLVAAPVHHHDDMVNGGRGQQAISQHADALHCKHHAIEAHSDCTICSFISHTITIAVVAVVPQFNPKSIQNNTTFFFVVVFDVFSTHTRRGPPVNLV